MDFTREPIIQTVITPKDGCKIVVRSSKNSGQEEYFVDAVEVVCFGAAIFFRSLERPKSFLVPASDYEILEVREARMVLKNVGVDRAIKIGGGRDAAVRGGREQPQERHEPAQVSEPETASIDGGKAESKVEQRLDKKRDRRRNARRRRGRDDAAPKDEEEDGEENEKKEKIELPKPNQAAGDKGELLPMTSVLTALLPPPPTLISETIARYRDNASFRGAFFSKDDQETPESLGQTEDVVDAILPPTIPLQQPEFGSFEMSEQEEEEIYRERHSAHETDVVAENLATGEESVIEEEHPQENETKHE